MNEQVRKHQTSWIVIGPLAGLVAIPTVVALIAVIVRDLRGPVFDDHTLVALGVTGMAGIVIGAASASRALRSSPRVMIRFGLSPVPFWERPRHDHSPRGRGDRPDWPSGLAAFATGASLGAVAGGVTGGVCASARVTAPTVG